MFCGPVELMDRAQKELATCGFSKDFTAVRTQYDYRDLCIVDLLNAGCSKGHALERWARHRGIDRSEIMAIGDNYNDIDMLTFAGSSGDHGKRIGRPEAEWVDGHAAP